MCGKALQHNSQVWRAYANTHSLQADAGSTAEGVNDAQTVAGTDGDAAVQDGDPLRENSHGAAAPVVHTQPCHSTLHAHAVTLASLYTDAGGGGGPAQGKDRRRTPDRDSAPKCRRRTRPCLYMYMHLRDARNVCRTWARSE